jgi:Na+/H+ antiporter
MEQDLSFYIVLLLIVACLVMLAGKLKIAYPIILVLGGLAISFLPFLPGVSINPKLIFLLFLPPLLYEAAWQISWKDFWKWRRVISSFAFIIVILTSGVVALISTALIPGFNLPLGFLLGGIISPPDAVAATSILKSVKAPHRIVAIVEGESLLNDASSLIVYRFALITVLTGTFVFHQALLSFFLVIIMGVVTGLVIAFIFYLIHKWLPTTASIDIVLSFIVPYIMYITAEKLHFSGVLAVVSGGLFLSGRRHLIYSNHSRIQGLNVWTTIGFVFNGLIFLLIGLELPHVVRSLGTIALQDAIKYSVIISFVIIITRLFSTLGASLFTTIASKVITTADSHPGWRGPFIFGWVGMRGVVSLASALSIPLTLNNGEAFPQRNLILFITFSVILFTLVFQGITLPWVVRRLHEPEKDYILPRYRQDTIIRKAIKNEALALLKGKFKDEVRSNELLQILQSRLESELTYFKDHHQPASELSRRIDHYHVIYRQIIDKQRSMLLHMNMRAEFEEDIIRKHFTQLDLEEEKLTKLAE